MRTANRKTVASEIYSQLIEVRMSEHDRQLAPTALRDAEAIVDALLWIKARITAFGAMLPKRGFKHQARS